MSLHHPLRDCCATSPDELHAPSCASPAGEAQHRRRRRWATLAEDGAIFGLTAKESAELAAREAEFGPSGLAAEHRS